MKITGRNYKKIIVRKSKQALTTAVKADKALKMVKKLNHDVETKYNTPTVYTTALDTSPAGTVFNLVQIAQGDAATSRDGNQIDLKSISIRYGFKSSAGSTLGSCAVRLLIVQDLQQVQATAINMGDVLITGSTWDSMYNFPNRVGRFKVLVDKFIVVNPTSVSYASAGSTASSFDTYHLGSIKLTKFVNNGRIIYSGTGVNDLQKNGIYISLCKSNSNYTVNPEINVQTKFTDS